MRIKKTNKDWSPTYEENWRTYDVNVDEENIPDNIKKMSPEFTIQINKDKTQLRMYNSFGDELICDLKTGETISWALGF